MIFRYIYRPFAKIDLKEAVKYYIAISPSLAKAFLLRIREAKKFISLSPYGDDIVYTPQKNQPFTVGFLLY